MFFICRFKLPWAWVKHAHAHTTHHSRPWSSSGAYSIVGWFGWCMCVICCTYLYTAQMGHDGCRVFLCIWPLFRLADWLVGGGGNGPSIPFLLISSHLISRISHLMSSHLISGIRYHYLLPRLYPAKSRLYAIQVSTEKSDSHRQVRPKPYPTFLLAPLQS